MKKRFLLKILFIVVAAVGFGILSYDLLSLPWSSKTSQKEHDRFLEKMYAAYNKKDLDEYCRFFEQEINVTKEQGLGNIRIITGYKEFRDYYENVFRTKRSLKLTLLESFAVPPWVLVKELIEHEDKVYEAAVGYRIQNDRIIHKMILSDRFVYDKKSLFDTKK